ncbi:MAG: hypothetical protein IT186_11000 [Acidobacteria bacterium]|nr:hypothetical protein [Acidobacteriota bacterium]MCG3194660.1 hypothetical protein [Thermoanaerobaculia bacterium]MCK6683575.1 hypothetical protein [Thermoanaerobaculia bacterium]
MRHRILIAALLAAVTAAPASPAFAGGNPLPADENDSLSSDHCGETDLECLLEVQRRQLEALEASRQGSSKKSTGTRKSQKSLQSQSVPSSDICADDDLECLLAVQRRQLEALEASRGTTGGSARTSNKQSVASSAPVSACCLVNEIRGLQLQRQHPASGRTTDITQFLSTDTYIYLVADLRGNQSGSTVTFRWVKVDSNGVERDVTSRDQTIQPGNTWVYGSFYYKGLTPTGRYRVHVYFDGILAGTREFRVVAGSSFG